MNKRTQIEFMIYPIPPYSSQDVQNEINSLITSIALESGLDSGEIQEKLAVQSERYLLKKEDIETVKIILEIVNLLGPSLKKLIKNIYELLRRKFGKTRIIRITIGDKTIDVPFTRDEKIEVILDELDN